MARDDDDSVRESVKLKSQTVKAYWPWHRDLSSMPMSKGLIDVIEPRADNERAALLSHSDRDKCRGHILRRLGDDLLAALEARCDGTRRHVANLSGI